MNLAGMAAIMCTLFLFLAVVTAIIGIVRLVIYFCGENPVMDWSIIMETAKAEVIVMWLVVSGVFFFLFCLLEQWIFPVNAFKVEQSRQPTSGEKDNDSAKQEATHTEIGTQDGIGDDS